MQVRVRRFNGTDTVEVEASDATIADVLKILGFDSGGFRLRLNEQPVDGSAHCCDGDTVSLHPRKVEAGI